jgi:hypothetical protein
MSAVVSIYLPHNLLPGLAALKTFSESVPQDTLVLLWLPPHLNDERQNEISHTVRKLLKAYPSLQLKVLPEKSEDSVEATVQELKSAFPKGFSEIYFSHDLGEDQINQCLMAAFPAAKRICYGDSLGTVYTAKYFQKIHSPSWAEILRYPSLWSSAFKSCFAKRTDKSLEPQIAALILPSDPGGDFFHQGRELRVVPHDLALESCLELAAAVPEFDSALLKLSRNEVSSQPVYCLVMSNLTEAQLTTAENEIELYQRIVRSHVPVGSRIILKAHPAAESQRSEQLRKLIAQNFEVLAMPAEFLSFPIEVAPRFAARATFLSISYSSLSLRYLHKARTIHCLEDSLIDEFFFAAKQRYMKSGNDLYLKMLQALETWDEQSLLVKGLSDRKEKCCSSGAS